MPALETRDRKQWMVFWECVGQDPYGLPIVSDGIELKVRWNDKLAQVIDPTGNTIQSTAQIITDRTLPLQSIVRKGRLSEVTGPPYSGLHIVIGDQTTPDLKNRNNRYEFALMRYSQQLPQKTGTGT